MGLDNMEMKPKEAAEILYNVIKCAESLIEDNCGDVPCENCQYNTSLEQQKKATEVAMSALEKQTHFCGNCCHHDHKDEWCYKLGADTDCDDFCKRWEKERAR